MDKPLVTIKYKTANGKCVYVEVSPEVKEAIETADRKLRSQARQDRWRLDSREYIDGFTDAAIAYPSEDVIDFVIRMERYNQLYAAMETLTAVQKRRLHLYYFCGLTYQKIGEREGVAHTTIGRSIKQAIEIIRKYIAE